MRTALAALALSTLASPALAIEPAPPRGVEAPGTVALQDDSDTEAPAEDSASTEDGLVIQEVDQGRDFDMEVGFRGRYMNVPKAILDIWFYDADDPSYRGPSDGRPNVQAYTVGMEFVVKQRPSEERSGTSNGIFYVQWIDNLTREGYWDDVEEPHDPFDGDYLIPTDNLGMVALGANYAYEVHMVKTMNTNGNFGMSMLFGSGLGLGVVIGQLDYCRPENGVPSYERCGDPNARDGLLEPEPKRIPPVFPILDVNLGLRFNFGDRFVMRFEGGVQDFLYGGGSVGIMF